MSDAFSDCWRKETPEEKKDRIDNLIKEEKKKVEQAKRTLEFEGFEIKEPPTYKCKWCDERNGVLCSYYGDIRIADAADDCDINNKEI